MAEIVRVDGVILSPADAQYLARALVYFADALRKLGAKPNPRVTALHGQLVSAVQGSESLTGVSVSADSLGSGASFDHDVLDTATAAGILGCSPANARDLARRGKIPARRVGGRWLLDAHAVRARAVR